MEIHIPTGARKIIARLEQHGYEAISSAAACAIR